MERKLQVSILKIPALEIDMYKASKICDRVESEFTEDCGLMKDICKYYPYISKEDVDIYVYYYQRTYHKDNSIFIYYRIVLFDVISNLPIYSIQINPKTEYLLFNDNDNIEDVLKCIIKYSETDNNSIVKEYSENHCVKPIEVTVNYADYTTNSVIFDDDINNAISFNVDEFDNLFCFNVDKVDIIKHNYFDRYEEILSYSLPNKDCDGYIENYYTDIQSYGFSIEELLNKDEKDE